MTLQLDAIRLTRFMAQQEVRDVVLRYCRGIDRMDWDLVRSCYHPDATDDHGDFRGNVDEFIAYIQQGLPRFDRTQHFVGNILVEIDGDRARAETYLVAYHRLLASRTKPLRDYTVGLRYIDDFERRDGEWRISARVCAFDWARIDPVAPDGWSPSAPSTLGRRDRTDAVYAASLVGWNP